MNPGRYLFWPAVALSLLLFPQFNTRASTDDWSVAILDKILEEVQPGQRTARVDDMEILVPQLLAWRNQMAGGALPQSALDGNTPPWTGGNIYYSFSNNVSAVKQKAFLDGAAEWAMFADLRFIPRSNQAN